MFLRRDSEAGAGAQKSLAPGAVATQTNGRQHTMNAVDKISPKFMSWAAACRGFPKAESMAADISREAQNCDLAMLRPLKLTVLKLNNDAACESSETTVSN